ncbi:hypothetical protein FHW36_105452 [Chitinophaga polysaccharea]|uniref:Uncharacterized protein n=1 Tax=Chitinophaga polysaccharea TaxID=1293035 RepID=A0A561PPI4_9BACT|nr:hypothetical protein FHW36_105452 [Chitinophaga polysaccharea]
MVQFFIKKIVQVFLNGHIIVPLPIIRATVAGIKQTKSQLPLEIVALAPVA